MTLETETLPITVKLKRTHQQENPCSREVLIKRTDFSPRRTLQTLVSVVSTFTELEGSCEPFSVWTVYDQEDLDSDVFYIANALIDMLAEIGFRGLSAPYVFIENPTQEAGDGMTFIIIQPEPRTILR